MPPRCGRSRASSARLAFDNLSSVPHWLSDALCRLATGGSFAVRQLYTDDEEVLFEATRPITGSASDLLRLCAEGAREDALVAGPPWAKNPRALAGRLRRA